MDHAEVLEIVELAAAEPGGLDRLVAGDTLEAASVAGHLAGCPDCVAELEGVRRAAGVLRDVVRTTPPPDLRARTLAYVTTVGRPRGPVPVAAAATSGETSSTVPDRESATARPSVEMGGNPSVARPWLFGLAATIVVSVLVSGAMVGALAWRALDARDAALAEQTGVVAALSRVAAWGTRVAAEPDSRSVRLTSPTGDAAVATIVYSPSTRELVIVAEDLDEPPAGEELRCWVEVNGERKPVGRMFFGGDLSYWAGEVDAVDGLEGDAKFGISLAGPDGTGGGSAPVLSGDL